jgi:catechol 2,3-dioxygenase-like lactoylglutathione lyase family enzyme
MTGPVLDQLNIVVTDMEQSATFYRLLGLEVPEGPPEWAPHHRSAVQPEGIDLDLDSEVFAGRWDTGIGPATVKPRVVIGFRMPSRDAVDSTYKRLTEAGFQGQQVPYDAFWGSRYAVVEDPDGNAVGLMSEREDAFRSQTDPPS